MPKVGGRRVLIILILEKEQKSQVTRRVIITFITKNLHIQERKVSRWNPRSHPRST